ncbi:MAG: hypothetical protein IKE42_25240 [Aquamicrobium sp.]|uniref:hypothetical protein n=2 Tax=Pseudomonadati TaxID=3379134 RepID=UPI0010126192|nr:hypothetical protein [Mesorhizobium sp. Pch-S]MBR2691170.1 hypothetical protein [Aquamicrobium sp.]QAZ44527.1 hypothetical protein C1M53_17870 [Mesorhizobium sp. Pch-S]
MHAVCQVFRIERLIGIGRALLVVAKPHVALLLVDRRFLPVDHHAMKCGIHAQYDKLEVLGVGGDRPLTHLLTEIVSARDAPSRNRLTSTTSAARSIPTCRQTTVGSAECVCQGQGAVSMLKSPIKISAAARARLVIDMEQLRPAAGVELIPAILWEKYEVSIGAFRETERQEILENIRSDNGYEYVLCGPYEDAEGFVGKTLDYQDGRYVLV